MTFHAKTQSFVDPATGTVSPALTLPANYALEFSDEFNDNTIDLTKWNIDNSPKSRAGRDGLKIDDWWWKPDNAYEQEGNLVLDVDKFDFNTMHCGSINSKDKYESTFGYYEVRIKIAEAAKGTHTAFWLQGQNMNNVDNSGRDGAEIDVFESAWVQNYTKCVVHIDGYGADKQALTKQYNTPNIHNGQYHTWGFLWEPDKMTIYYDGVLSATYTEAKFIPQVDEYLWLSDGASFGIMGDNFTSQPNGYLTSAYVDYIRVWHETETTSEAFVPKDKLYWSEYGLNIIDGEFQDYLPAIDATALGNIASNTSDWYVSGGNYAQQQVTAEASGLTLEGYPQIGTGRALRFQTKANVSGGFNYDQNIVHHRRLGNPTGNQTIYMSFILSVFRVNAVDLVSFPIGFGNVSHDPNNPFLVTDETIDHRIYVKNSGTIANSQTGSYQVGISKIDGATTFATSKTYTANGASTEGIFVLVKLTLDENSADVMQLYTSTTMPASEPETWDVTLTDGTDVNVNSVFLREKMDSPDDNFLDLGGIRVADSWDGLFASIYTDSWSLGEPSAAITGILRSNLAMNTDLIAKNLKVEEGAILTVSSGSTLDVKGDIHNSGDIIVASGGALLVYEGKSLESVTVRRNSSFEDVDLRYSFIGSPVASFDISDLNSAYHYSYNTSDNTYATFSGSMIAGVGYTTAGKKSLEFVGTPNTGNISVTLNDAGDKFNLVSNPYTTAISRSTFVDGNSNITGAIYLWDDGGSNNGQRTSADFLTVTNAGSVSVGSGGSGATFGGNIGSAQGFIIQASAEGDVTFTEAMRVSGSNGDANYFRKEDQLHTVKLAVSGEVGSDETLLAFTEEGSWEFDRMWDAGKIPSENALKLYSIMQDTKLAIQTLPSLNDLQHIEVPLGLESKSEREVSISIKEHSLPQGYVVILRDNLTGKSYNLTEQSREVFINANDKDRFSLSILSPKAILASTDLLPNMKVFVNEDWLNLETEAIRGTAQVTILDLSGKIYFSSKMQLDEKGNAILNLASIKKGMYIVRVAQGDKMQSTKFYY